jgi:hypothetical protein
VSTAAAPQFGTTTLAFVRCMAPVGVAICGNSAVHEGGSRALYEPISPTPEHTASSAKPPRSPVRDDPDVLAAPHLWVSVDATTPEMGKAIADPVARRRADVPDAPARSDPTQGPRHHSARVSRQGGEAIPRSDWPVHPTWRPGRRSGPIRESQSRPRGERVMASGR